MPLLQECGGGTGFLKAGLLGFAGSGKTFTAKELAVGTRAHFGLKGPIAMFDTEAGSEYIAKDVERTTGLPLLATRSRSFDDLVGVTDECMKRKASVLIVDSVTHVWRDLCASYLRKINDKRVSNNLGPRLRLEFRDWSPLKDHWNDKWTNWYLNSPIHVIIAGRAGFEYDFSEDEESGKKEIVKTGIKMKTETEFGFEPSLLIEMERVQELADHKRRVIHRATILKDRFGAIDGQQADNPGFEFFKPHVALLTPGAVASVDTEARSDVPVDDDGWSKEKRERAILAEEIQGEILRLYPGQTVKEKSSKADLLYSVFGTRSWTKVESMKTDRLRDGLARIRDAARVVPQETAGEEAAQ